MVSDGEDGEVAGVERRGNSRRGASRRVCTVVTLLGSRRARRGVGVSRHMAGRRQASAVGAAAGSRAALLRCVRRLGGRKWRQ